MGIRTLTPEERASGNDAITRRMMGAVDDMAQEYINTDTVEMLSKPIAFPYDGEQYIAAPVSVPDGLTITKLLTEIEKLKGRKDDEALLKMDVLFKHGVALLKDLLYPARYANKRGRLRGWRRWIWRGWSRNPFTEMSERDFTTALLFLAMCRMMSSIDTSSGVAGPRGSRSTSSMAISSSLNGSLN